MQSLISITNLKKNFGGTALYQDFDLEIETGKITTIFGPNGTGKSTILNIIAGITQSDGGAIDFQKTKISYIFQNYRESLLPWKTNYRNLSFPLELAGFSEEEISEKIEEIKKIFEFDCDWNAYPYTLSGGQQQILAFMRALVTSPQLLLIDEPFSALDYENNLRLRKHLGVYYEKYKPTVVLITHNVEEAVHLSDTIIIVSKRPTRVKGSVQINLTRPRSVETLKSERFHRIKDEVLELFQKTIRI